MNTSQLKLIEEKATELGFDAVGWTNNLHPQHADYFRNWLKDKKQGDMTWFERTAEQRLDPTKIDSNIFSALVLLTSYNHTPSIKGEVHHARYSFGEDYHIWIGEHLEKLIQFIKAKIDSSFIGQSFIDTGPLLERDLAAQAGLGWIGKNTCLIHPKLGSFVFISVILTNMGLPCRDATPRVSNRCHSCTKCLSACPTQALKPHRLDQQRCLAYQANAKKGERDRAVWDQFGNSILGCDICQEVCPWNEKTPDTHQKEWQETFEKYHIADLKELLQMTESDYKAHFKGSVLDRNYIDQMRNVFLVIAFQRRRDLLDDVRQWRERHPALNVAECHYCLEVLQ